MSKRQFYLQANKIFGSLRDIPLKSMKAYCDHVIFRHLVRGWVPILPRLWARNHMTLWAFLPTHLHNEEQNNTHSCFFKELVCYVR